MRLTCLLRGQTLADLEVVLATLLGRSKQFIARLFAESLEIFHNSDVRLNSLFFHISFDAITSEPFFIQVLLSPACCVLQEKEFKPYEKAETRTNLDQLRFAKSSK